MEDFFITFTVFYRKRCTMRQKLRFLGVFCPSFKQFGYDLKFDNKTAKKKQERVHNALIGNVNKARYIFAAGYDTPLHNLLPYRYYPFNAEKNVSVLTANYLFRVVLAFLLGLGLFFTSYKGIIPPSLFLRIVLYLAVGISAFFLFRGTAEKNNFNRNSAAAGLLYFTAEALKKSGGAAFAYVDRSSDSFRGWTHLAETAGKGKKIFITLDCIAAGETLFIARRAGVCGREAEFLKEKLGAEDYIIEGEKTDRTVPDILGNALCITSGSLVNGEIIIRPKSDGDFNLERLERIKNALVSLTAL